MVVVVKLTRCYSLLVFLVFYWSSHLVVAKDPLCDMPRTIPMGHCCPRVYAKYCCSGIPVCSDSLNTSDVRMSFETLCSSPWNSTACLQGFFSTNGNNTTSCPGGYFCEENTVCLKPCPVGAYCIENTLVSVNCTGFQKCCPPSDKAPIYDSQSQTFMCAGQFYPARCQEGFYCPNTTSMLKCPSGHFCRQGSNRPIKCPMPSFCGEGETSPNTLYIGLIINGCLLVSFFLILLLFANRHAVKFYFYLYKGRATGKRRSSRTFNIADGMRMAVHRIQNFNTSKDELKMERKDTYNISFEKLRLKLTSGTNKGKVLLQGVTGQIKAGEVTAVLGPSGAGKTTFLNVLCGKAYYGESGGTIKINGREVKGIQDYKSLTGFVPQDDIMHRSLTVEEVLYYNALLRLPPQEDPKYYGKMVKKVLNLLGIRHVANTQIGDEETRGISGGQRRRVNIGMELVADPTILFLDEPTTGLDSSSSLAVVKSLNTVASAENLTVLCVIHQPRYEILRMFDKVLFLGRGGRTVYLGSVEDAEVYFANIGFPLPPYVNPADFYMDVISGTIKSQLPRYTDLFQEWENHQNPAVEEISVVSTSSGTPPSPASGIILHASNIKTQINNIEESPPSVTPPLESAKLKRIRPGFFVQLWIFIKREFVLQLHMAKTLLLDQAFTLIAGAALGLLFREVYIYDVHETTVLGNIVSGLAAVVAATRRFGLSRVVYWRESASGINRFSYFLAVNIAYIPVLLISPAVYLSIYYSVAAFLAPFSLHYLVFLCGWFYLSGLGYVMSLILNPRNSQMAAIITVVIMALLSGGSPELCKLDDTFIATAFYNLSFSRWIAEAVFEIEAAERSEVLRDIISAVQIDNHYDLTSFNTCIIALLSLGFGLRVIALLLLLFTKRGQQK